MKKEKIKKYEKSIIVKQTEMTFPIDIMKAYAKTNGKVITCIQCTACHSCR